MELTEEELQQKIAEAVAKKADEIRAELQSIVDTQQEHAKTEHLSKAANEGAHLHVDPGNGYEYAVINLDRVDYNPLSRRTEDDLHPDNLQTLIEDIKKRGGLMRPLLVYRKDDRYMLVKGARRLAALRAMGEELTHAYILPAKPPMSMEEGWVNGY